MQGIEKSNILEKLVQSGLKLYKNEQGGIDIKSYPHYRNNFGFFHVVINDAEIIILKGQYSDNVRNIKGRCPFNNAEISELINTLVKSETSALSPCNMDLYMLEDDCFIKNVEIVTDNNKYINRDYKIPRPLSSSEYSEPKSRMYDEEVILSQGYFGSYMPNVLSHFTASIFNELLDILNPIFISCNLKTVSPSIMPLYGRLYINMTAYEKMMHTIGLNKSLFRRIYAPNLFLKMGISKLDKINRSFFPVTKEEINEVFESLKERSVNMDITIVSNKSFYDYIVQLVIIYEYISIELTNNLSVLLKKFPNISMILNAVYKTRDNSIFYGDKEYILPDFMDFGADIKKVTFNMEKNKESLKKHLKFLPFYKRKSKLKKAVKSIHELLDMRDELYLLAADIVVKSKATLEKIGQIGVDRSKLNNISDIFYLDHDEIRRLLNDTLFGDTLELINFRKWRNKRYAAQVMPPEIYGYDLSDTPHIAENMINSYMEQDAFAVYGLNRIKCKGQLEPNIYLDDYTDKIVSSTNIPVTRLNYYKSAAGLLIENISPFSLAAEFAVLNNIPLWTGSRFNALFMKNVEIEKNTLFKVNND